MPAPAPSARSRRRRFVNEINVVPYIDVMLVLLVIFMVTAPLMPPGVIDLPRAGKSSTRPTQYVEVMVRADGELHLRTGNTGDPTERRIALGDLEGNVRTMLQEIGDDGAALMISADRTVPYERVISVLSRLQAMNIARVGLMVRPGN